MSREGGSDGVSGSTGYFFGPNRDLPLIANFSQLHGLIWFYPRGCVMVVFYHPLSFRSQNHSLSGKLTCFSYPITELLPTSNTLQSMRKAGLQTFHTHLQYIFTLMLNKTSLSQALILDVFSILCKFYESLLNTHSTHSYIFCHTTPHIEVGGLYIPVRNFFSPLLKHT